MQWNNLECELKNIPTLSSFKEKLKLDFLETFYSNSQVNRMSYILYYSTCYLKQNTFISVILTSNCCNFILKSPSGSILINIISYYVKISLSGG